MNSIIGRIPCIAAPTPIPVNPASVIGVSTIRVPPNYLYNPLDILYAPSYYPTSSPIKITLGSRVIS